MLRLAAGPEAPARKPKGCLTGALLCALVLAGAVTWALAARDREFRCGGLCFAVQTLDSNTDPISALIAPPGLYYHDLGRPDANYWTWRWGQRYVRFPR